ncbi:MAG TPA: glycosyltransferase family 4 protein [Anaerolineae bacterium]|nr:glycosyltransferase family 4 protein [Anaerolineae bacterium]
MRVLITSDIFPPEVGGPATYVPMIARELTGRGHSVRVLTYSSTSSDASDAARGFKIERIMVGGSRLRRLSRAFVRVAANAWRAEILYVNGLLVETTLVNLLLRKPAVAKVVGDLAWERARDKGWIADGFETFQRAWYGWRVELRRALRTWALSQMRAVVVPSVYLREAVIGWRVDRNRVHVVPNALEPFADDTAPEVLPLTTKHRLITICRLTGWKGVDGIIEAIDALPDVGLVVVGDGPEQSALEALTRQLRSTDRICFLGRVARERIGGYLGACDLFVLNSRYEGLPHAVLEAMAAGLPVVATRVGGISEAVEDGVNGYLVEPGDVDGLRRAITETLEDADLRARCQAAKLEIGRRFSRDVMVQATERVLEEARG